MPNAQLMPRPAPPPRRAPVRRAGVGDGGTTAADYLPSVLASLPPDQAKQLSGVVNNFEQIRSMAKQGIASLAQGRGVSAQQLTAVIATAASLVPALGPVGGAFVAEMGILSGLMAAVQSILDPLGLTAKGSVNQTTYCGWIPISPGGGQTVSPPYGPDDPRWLDVPHPDAVDMTQDPATWHWSNVGTPGNIGSHLAFIYAGQAASAPGTFEEFFYDAALHNAALAWNCQPSALDPQILLRAAVELWNEAHAASSSYTIAPVVQPDQFGQTYDWHNPDLLISWIAAGSLSPSGTPSLPPQQINTGPLVTDGGLVISPGKGGAVLANQGGTGMSTGAKVAIGGLVVAGAAAGGVGIWAWLTHQAYTHAWKKIWDETGGKVVDKVRGR